MLNDPLIFAAQYMILWTLAILQTYCILYLKQKNILRFVYTSEKSLIITSKSHSCTTVISVTCLGEKAKHIFPCSFESWRFRGGNYNHPDNPGAESRINGINSV
jgi:hypothetical protein